MTLRVVFMGTPEFAVPTLAEVHSAGHEVVAVYCQPPRPAGRGMAPRPSPVQDFAEGAGLPVFTPTSLKGVAEQKVLASRRCDVAVVVAYGLILPPAVLEIPRLGCFNLHPSALPRWRGAAPIQRTLMAGDEETAVMVMRMDAGLDTGPVALAEYLPVGPNVTAGELHDDLARRGADLMVRALAELEQGTLALKPQAETGVSYAAKIDKAEARIDFTRPAVEVHNLIRGLSPSPGAWFEAPLDGRGERIKVLRSKLSEASGDPGVMLDEHLTVACGSGAVQLATVQRAGKKAVSAEEFLRGFPLHSGELVVRR